MRAGGHGARKGGTAKHWGWWMAILWEKTVRGVRYEVRTAGMTRRLYTDGVLHTQYNANNPVTGSVWDLLLLPAFFHPSGALRRVLVLGVGGGAVIRQMRHFTRPHEIVGVELNPVHLHIAKRFFGVGGKGVRLHRADAVRWLRAYQGAPFDMIVDDLFNEEDGEPVRAVDADVRWFDCLLEHLTRDGTLVMNFPTPGDLGRCAYASSAATRRRFKAAFQLSTPRYENAVGAFLRRSSSSAALRTNAKSVDALKAALAARKLIYHIRRIG